VYGQAGLEIGAVAKVEMICPFSSGICEECALYRGRHYYLCFCREYRGYLGSQGQVTGQSSVSIRGTRPNGKFEMPARIPSSAIDPFVSECESHHPKEG
jgi:hypothetical protein